MQRKPLWLSSLFAFSLLALPGCGSDDADAENGACTIVDLGNGNSAIRCPDAPDLVVENGKDGAPGKAGENGPDGKNGLEGQDGKAVAPPCSIEENADGTHTLTCGDQSVVIGDECEGGFPSDLRSDDRSLTLFQVTGCTWIRGSVIVEYYDEKELPKAFSRITKVDGELRIKSNDELTTIAFPALAYVGGHMTIGYNAELSTIGDFPALKTVKGQLSFIQNRELISIGDFPNLETLEGDLNVWYHDKLESIGSFDKLISIENGGLAIFENSSLVQMGAFPALESVDSFFFFDNDSIESLPAFSSLKTITGRLEIYGNAELQSIAGLASLERIEGWVDISDNPKLPQCHVDDILSNIDYDEPTSTIIGNDDTTACP